MHFFLFWFVFFFLAAKLLESGMEVTCVFRTYVFFLFCLFCNKYLFLCYIVVYKTKASNKDRKIRKSSLWFMLVVQPGRVGAMNSPGDGVALGSCRSIVDIRL